MIGLKLEMNKKVVNIKTMSKQRKKGKKKHHFNMKSFKEELCKLIRVKSKEES